jgi:hypothetical protein
VLAAIRDWCERYDRMPSSYDWSRTHANRRAGVALKRLDEGEWPPASVVGQLFGSWQEARDMATSPVRPQAMFPPALPSPALRESAPLIDARAINEI